MVFKRHNKDDIVKMKYGFAVSVLVFLVSFLTFAFILNPVETNLFLFVSDILLFVILMTLIKPENADILWRVIYTGLSIALGFAASKIYRGENHFIINTNNADLRNILLSALFIEVLIVFLTVVLGNMNSQANDDGSEMPVNLYPERENDLERLTAYLSQYSVVGVNGIWGSGKTVLVDEYIIRNTAFHVIKVEALACNLDEIDAYLFRRLESVLWQESIFPRYSRKLQKLLTSNSWLNKIINLDCWFNYDNTTAFDGFCRDLDKLDRPVLLVFEDIDRISEAHKDQISKILDLSEKLQKHKVKVIYEIDMLKMAELGYSHDYIEKFMPYIVNVSILELRKLILYYFEERTGQQFNGDLNIDDFSFLFGKMYMEPFLMSCFGFNVSIEITIAGATPRRTAIFIDEVNTALSNTELHEYKQTVISYFFIKHFYNDLYENIDFDDVLDSIKFWTPDGRQCYSIRELLGNKNDKNVKINIPGMFISAAGNDPVNEENRSEYSDTIIQSNKDRLGLLHMLDYKLAFENDKKNLEKEMDKETEGSVYNMAKNPLLNADEEIFKRIDHNEKISKILRYLFYSSHSEYTDQEAMVERFITEVISAPNEKWLEKWHDLLKRARQENYNKDNRTIFRWGEKDEVALFRAISVCMNDTFGRTDPDSCNESDYSEDKILKSLKFIKMLDSETGRNELDLDKITIFYLCPIAGKRIFIEVLQYFIYLNETGNFNKDKVFMRFLRKYLEFAFYWGYLPTYDSFRLDVPGKDVSDYLEECVGRVRKKSDSLNDRVSAKKELTTFCEFLEKCIRVINLTAPGKSTRMTVETSIREKDRYLNEEVYQRFTDRIENASEGDSAEIMSIMDDLDGEYGECTLTLREYERLGGMLLKKDN